MFDSPSEMFKKTIWREGFLLAELISNAGKKCKKNIFKDSVFQKLLTLSHNIPDDIVISQEYKKDDEISLDLIRISAYLELATRLSIISIEDYKNINHKIEKLWHIFRSSDIKRNVA